MIQPEIITKKFLLAGFAAEIDLKESHWQGMDDVKTSLKNYIDKIIHKVNPVRFIGIWEADPNTDYSKKENHSKRIYFYGVEVSSLDDIPPNCAMRNFPESSFAIFKEREHGSPKYEWLKAAGYTQDSNFQEKYMLDMEVFDNIDDEGVEWDVLIPIHYPK